MYYLYKGNRSLAHNKFYSFENFLTFFSPIPFFSFFNSSFSSANKPFSSANKSFFFQ